MSGTIPGTGDQTAYKTKYRAHITLEEIENKQNREIRQFIMCYEESKAG